MFLKRFLITFSVGAGIIVSAAIDSGAREKARSARDTRTHQIHYSVSK